MIPMDELPRASALAGAIKRIDEQIARFDKATDFRLELWTKRESIDDFSLEGGLQEKVRAMLIRDSLAARDLVVAQLAALGVEAPDFEESSLFNPLPKEE